MLPVVEAVKRNLDVIISVDTSNPELIRQCRAAGAGLINDVRALAREGALEAAAVAGLPVCLMHMQGSPEDMQDAPGYEEIVTDIAGFSERSGLRPVMMQVLIMTGSCLILASALVKRWSITLSYWADSRSYKR